MDVPVAARAAARRFHSRLERGHSPFMPILASVTAATDAAPHAHLTTMNADGSPQVSVVWVGLEKDELVISHLGEWTKGKTIRRDSRVKLSMLGPKKNPMALLECPIVYGKATITEGGAAELLQRLARRRLGARVECPSPAYRDRPGYVTHVTPERFAGVGPWPAKQGSAGLLLGRGVAGAQVLGSGLGRVSQTTRGRR